MVQIYRESLRYYWVSLPALVLFSTMIEGTIWYLQPKMAAAIMLVPLILVAYLFHRYFLFDERLTLQGSIANAAPGSPPLKYGWFMLASMGMIFIPVAIALTVSASQISIRDDKDAFVGLMMMIVFPLYLLALSLFGTALPALVERNQAYKLSAGLRTFFPTLWRLLLGPTLVGAFLFIVLIASDRLLANMPTYHSSVGQLLTAIISRTLGFLPTVLAVAVLCHVYQRAKVSPTGSTSAAP